MITIFLHNGFHKKSEVMKSGFDKDLIVWGTTMLQFLLHQKSHGKEVKRKRYNSLFCQLLKKDVIVQSGDLRPGCELV